jgi:hypothetical protein
MPILTEEGLFDKPPISDITMWLESSGLIGVVPLELSDDILLDRDGAVAAWPILVAVT